MQVHEAVLKTNLLETFDECIQGFYHPGLSDITKRRMHIRQWKGQWLIRKQDKIMETCPPPRPVIALEKDDGITWIKLVRPGSMVPAALQLGKRGDVLSLLHSIQTPPSSLKCNGPDGKHFHEISYNDYCKQWKKKRALPGIVSVNRFKQICISVLHSVF